MSKSRRKIRSIKDSSKATDSPLPLKSKRSNRLLLMILPLTTMISTAKSSLKRRKRVKMTKCIPQSSLNQRLPREINPMMRFKPKLSATNNQSKKPTTRIRKSKLFREHTNKTSALLSKRALSRTT